MNILSACNNNTCVYLLIAMVVLGNNGKDNAICSTNLPVIFALAYLLSKNGTIDSVINSICGKTCSCDCNA